MVPIPIWIAFSLSMVSRPSRLLSNKMCPYAQKAWIALECASVEYTITEIALYGAGGKPDWFKKLNPDGTVPVLVVSDGDKDVVLPDSDLILDAIEQGKIPSSSLTEASHANIAKVREWREIINNQFIPVGKRAVLNGSKAQLLDLLNALDSKVVGPFLACDTVTTADCHAFPFLWRIQQEFGLLNDYPALHIWLQQCESTDCFRTTIQRTWWWWW